MNEIGCAAGIVGPGVCRHLENKSAILVETFDRVIDQLMTSAEHSIEQYHDPGTPMAMLVNDQIDLVLPHRALCQVDARESGNLPRSDQQQFRRKQRAMCRCGMGCCSNCRSRSFVHNQILPIEVEYLGNIADAGVDLMRASRQRGSTARGRVHTPCPHRAMQTVSHMGSTAVALTGSNNALPPAMMFMEVRGPYRQVDWERSMPVSCAHRTTEAKCRAQSGRSPEVAT